ncbi:hypothetical protein PAXINDRAFT_84670 [Paxillus involutus ATCC 200175]|uniref:Unplaced genomic scaffold PAXINscaffold_59, whole genome shotgun sequence n=1 Tax=Paxillus involutus ATCC 200175 TaxID=664439 RepID=A0A0C9T6K7_PAXIN|nr:hypothetical protein PAXINDRAFT_84670 [Paxillus involutus ATCC 200175]
MPFVVSSASESSQPVSLEDASPRVPLQVFEGHENWVRCACFYESDENKLVSGSDDKTLRIWDRKTGAVEVLRGHNSGVQDLDISRDGKMIVSGNWRGAIRIWNRESGKTKHIVGGHKGPSVRSVRFSPDSRRVVSGSEDGTVRVWSVVTGKLAFKPIESRGWVHCVRYSQNGDRIASGGEASGVQIWDPESGTRLLSIQHSSVISIAWTPDGTHIIGGGEGKVTVWNSHNGDPLRTWKAHDDNVVTCACFFLDENKLVTGSGDRTLRIWDRKTGVVKVLSGHTDWVWEVDVSRDGKMVVSCSDDKTVRIWNQESGETKHVLKGHKDLVLSVGFSPDSSRVVSGSQDRTVRVWSVETGRLAFEPIKCRSYVWCVRYSPGGDRIASGGPLNGVQVWDANTGTAILSITRDCTYGLAWTPDGSRVIGGREGQVTIWNPRNGEQLRTWKAHNHWIRALTLSPSKTQLATCAQFDNIAFVFDALTGEKVAALEHTDSLCGIAYSPSGQFIATGCGDNNLYLWEAPVVVGPQSKVSFVLVGFTNH